MTALSENSRSAFFLSTCSFSSEYALNVMLSGIYAMGVKATLHRILLGSCRTLVRGYGRELSGTEPE